MDTPENIPWYRSNVLRGIAVSTIAGMLSRFHVTAQFVPQAGNIVDTALDFVTLVSAAYAAYSRVQHPLPNITATKGQADAANAKGAADAAASTASSLAASTITSVPIAIFSPPDPLPTPVHGDSHDNPASHAPVPADPAHGDRPPLP